MYTSIQIDVKGNMMNLRRRKAISMIEIGFIIFVLFFLYAFVVKQMLSDLKFSDMKRASALIYTELDRVTRKASETGGYAYKFRKEEDIIDFLSKSMQTELVCQKAKEENCWSSNWLWANPLKPGLKLETGQYIIADLTSSSCSSNLNIPNTCGILYIDVNGPNAPNLVGHDIIKLYLTINNIIPAGVKADIINPANTCDLINKFSWGCSARLLGMK